jgi:hypothetical protein
MLPRRGNNWEKPHRSVAPYGSNLVELEEQNSVEEPVHQQGQVSSTDPDST